MRDTASWHGPGYVTGDRWPKDSVHHMVCESAVKRVVMDGCQEGPWRKSRISAACEETNGSLCSELGSVLLAVCLSQ